MMRKIILIVFTMLISSSVFADTITLESGLVIEGEIVERTADYIKIDTGIGLTTTHYVDEIESITEDSTGGENSGSDTKVNEIIDKVFLKYNNLDHYSSTGRVITNLDTGGGMFKSVKSFEMRLAKPNKYKIVWEENHPVMGNIKGAVWNSGDGAYNYQGSINNYHKMGGDEINLGAAAGVSSGITNTIPSLFFDFQHSSLRAVKNFKLTGTENVRGEECYVLTGESPVSHEHSFWISKESYLIVKSSHAYGKAPEMPDEGEIEEQELIDSLKGMGMDANDDNIIGMKKMMEQAKNAVKTTELKGTSEENHTNINTDIKLSKSDFEFSVPEEASAGTKSYENLFKNMGSLELVMKAGEGQKLSASKAKELENEIKANPNDFESRIKLLGYYLAKGIDKASKQRQEHILWIIKNKPDYPDGKMISPYLMLFPSIDGSAYNKAKDLWLEQTEKHSNNATVLRNASNFFRAHDKKLSKELSDKAREIDPDHSSISDMYKNR